MHKMYFDVPYRSTATNQNKQSPDAERRLGIQETTADRVAWWSALGLAVAVIVFLVSRHGG
jgi:hypothetical protein